MEMVIDFPGGAKVEAHFGPYTVSTDQPPMVEAKVLNRPHLSYFLPPLEPAQAFLCSPFAGNAGFQQMAFVLFNELTPIS